MKKPWLILSLLILFSATAVAQPSQNSSSADPGLIPGDLFYPVESFAESLEVTVAGLVGGPEFKAKALANNAEESLTEANILAEKNRSEKASKMAQNYYNQMNNSKKLAETSRNSNLSRKIDNISRKNVERLEKVKEKVPQQAKEGIENAIQKSRGNRGPGSNPGKGGEERPSSPQARNNSGKAVESLPNTSQHVEKASNMSKEGLNGVNQGRVLNASNRPEELMDNNSKVSGRIVEGEDRREESSEDSDLPVTDSENVIPDADKASESSDNGSLDENPVNGNSEGLR